jgi:two-component system, NarL family, sensor histidine kinase EvgS
MLSDQGWWLSLVLVALLPAFTSAWAAGQPVKLPLTAAERSWLSQHPRIQVGIMDAWPPMNFVDKDGRSQGIGADYAAAINQRLGGAITLVPAPFKENYQRVLDKQLDALMDITQRPDREALFTFTSPYIVIPHVIVGRKGGDYFRNEQDLTGKTVALEHGFYNITYFKDNFPSVKIKEYASTSDALDAVARGEADAYAGNRAVVVYLVEKELLNNVRLMGKLSKPSSALQFGVKKDQLLLASILGKALASITAEEEKAIREKWVGGNLELGLTEAELAWLKEHPVIRVALDPDWAPIEFRDEHGVPRGISSDYLVQLSDLLGTHFEVASGQNWQTLLEKGKRREVDLFPSLMRTREREDFLAFSEVYLSLPIGIFTRQDAPYIGSIADLAGKKVAVIQGHGAEFLLKTNHPGLQLVPAASAVEALRKLKNNEADAFVDCTMSISYYLEQLGLTDVKLTAEISERYDQCMGVRSDWPELVPILNKALHVIPKSDQSATYSKWTAFGHGQKVDFALIWKIVAAALATVALFGFWNRRLGREIGARKQAEGVLQANQEALKKALEAAETADRLKSAFLATMSHELRTPLNSIIGFTGILLQGLVGPLNEEQKKQLGMVRDSSTHLLELINDVLDISKIEAGQLEVMAAPFNFRASLEKIIQVLRPLADKRGLALALQIAPDVETLTSDRRRVEQILMNLASNAIKFTERGSVTVACMVNAAEVEVRVRDTGIGIRAEDLGALFQPFRQVDTGTTRKYEGTGLGLSICKRLVELLGGRIWVESVLGEGSTFTFVLPLNGRKP